MALATPSSQPAAGWPSRSRLRRVDAIEIFFTSLLVLVSIVIAWFAVYVVYKLYKGQA